MLPDVIVDLARRGPSGLFCRKQVFKAGFNDVALLEWRRAGLIERLAPGWYRISGWPVPATQCLYLPTEYLRYKAGSSSPVMTAHGALAALEVPGFDLPCHPTMLVQHGCRVRVKDAPWHVQHTQLKNVPVLRRRGLRLAAPARALADLHFEGIATPELIQAVDDTRNSARLNVVELMEAWEALNHPGARRLLVLARSGAFDTESGGERGLLEEVFTARPPAPDCQVQVTPRYRADFAYVFAALIIEYYGEKFHAGRVDEDGFRSHECRSVGWDVYIVTNSMRRDPDGLADSVHELRRERENAILEGRIRRPPLPRQPKRRLPLRTLVPLG